MIQHPLPDPVYLHDQLAGRVRADDARVGFHPIGRVVEALLGRQQRQGALHGVYAEVLISREAQFASAQKETIAYSHVAGAMSADGFDRDLQVVQFELIGFHG